MRAFSPLFPSTCSRVRNRTSISIQYSVTQHQRFLGELRSRHGTRLLTARIREPVHYGFELEHLATLTRTREHYRRNPPVKRETGKVRTFSQAMRWPLRSVRLAALRNQKLSRKAHQALVSKRGKDRRQSGTVQRLAFQQILPICQDTTGFSPG